MVNTKWLRLVLVAVLLMVVMATGTLPFSYGAGKNDVITGSSAHDKITLLEVSDTPDPFSPKLANATFTGVFQVKETDGLGSADDKHNTEFRFFIRHTLVISNALNYQEVNTLTGETNVIAPPKEKGKDGDKKYFSATVSQLWNGLDAQGNIVTDGAYQYAITGELYRENLKHKGGQDKEPKIKLIGASNSLAGTISVDTAPPIVSTIPAQNAVITEHTPVIVVNYTDASGVDLSTLKIIFNNVDLTSQFSVTASQATYQIPEKLSDGLYTMAVTIKDILGQSASLTTTFSVVSAMGVVTPAGGGTVEVTESGSPLINSAIEIPPGAATEVVSAVISAPLPADVPSLPVGTTTAGPAVKLDTQPQITFASPITIKIPYNEALVIAAGGNEADVKLIKFDTTTNQWVNVPATVDTARNLVVAQVTSLSLFQAVLQENTQTVTLTEYFAPTNITSTATVSGPITAYTWEPYDIVVTGTTNASMCNWRAYKNGAQFAGAALVFGSSVNKTFSFTETTVGDYTYEFWFRGVKGAHNWPDFTKVSITVTVDSYLPNAPSNLTATVFSSSRINLAFQNNSNNEQGFILERKIGLYGTYEEMIFVNPVVSPSAPSMVHLPDIDLSPHTTYYYRAKTYNDSGRSACSNEVSATTLLETPTDLTATAVSDSQINLSWADNSQTEAGFIIERWNDLDFEQIATVGPNIVAFNDTNLSCRTWYQYRVKAWGSDSDPSNEAGAMTHANTDPNQPVGVEIRSKRSVGFSVNPPSEQPTLPYIPECFTMTYQATISPTGISGTYSWTVSPTDSSKVKVTGALTGLVTSGTPLPPTIEVHAITNTDNVDITFTFTPTIGSVVSTSYSARVDRTEFTRPPGTVSIEQPIVATTTALTTTISVDFHIIAQTTISINNDADIYDWYLGFLENAISWTVIATYITPTTTYSYSLPPGKPPLLDHVTENVPEYFSREIFIPSKKTEAVGLKDSPITPHSLRRDNARLEKVKYYLHLIKWEIARNIKTGEIRYIRWWEIIIDYEVEYDENGKGTVNPNTNKTRLVRQGEGKGNWPDPPYPPNIPKLTPPLLNAVIQAIRAGTPLPED